MSARLHINAHQECTGVHYYLHFVVNGVVYLELMRRRVPFTLGQGLANGIMHCCVDRRHDMGRIVLSALVIIM